METIRRNALIFLVGILLLSNVGYVHAEEDVRTQKYVSTIMDAYKNVLVQRDISKIEEMLPEKCMFRDYLMWRIAMMETLEVEYSNFDYLVTAVEEMQQDGSRALRIRFNSTYTYSNGAGIGYSNGHSLLVFLQDNGANLIIEDLCLENDDFFQAFTNEYCKQINACAIRCADDKDILASMVDEFAELKAEMREVEVRQTERDEIIEDSQDVVPYAASYYYSGARGAAYANKYAANKNTYFYDAGSDCTNFVSQCIWAGYGGWNATMSASTMQSNISSKVRMVQGIWFAGSGGGASAWENVNALWNFAVGNSGKGPKATGYNNGGYYTEVLPIDIGAGDVLQKSNEGTDYFHSMYVVSTPGGSNPGYNEILVAQHSSAYSTTTLAEALAISGRYMRQMKFVENSFDN